MRIETRSVKYIVISHLIFASFALFAQDRKPYLKFNKNYIELNTGTVDIQVPETYELANIILALTKDGLEHPVLINKDTEYYQAVINHFKPYKDHELLKELSIDKYINFRDNSFGYQFVGDSLTPTGHFGGLWNWNPVYMKANPVNEFYANLSLVEDFAKTSNFKTFYEKHKNVYRDLILYYENAISLNSMRDWLQEVFGTPQYDSFLLVFSPLIGGSHSADRSLSEGFNEALMFVSPPQTDLEKTKLNYSALVARMVFTEFDHSYVNPKSDTEPAQINQVMSNLDLWKDQQFYPTAYDVFNEYMTWVLFSFYAYDHFPSAIFNEVVQSIEATMARRKFIKFQEYNTFMIDWYRLRKKPVKINDIYQTSFDWMGKQ